jgi:hypothetical protein
MVRVRKGSSVIHQENKTFTHRSAALTWAKHREVALEDPSALIRVQQGAPTLAALIRWYIDNFESVSKWQRSKQAHLEFLERHALGKCNALTLTSAELIDHVRSRRAKGAGPATVANDLIWTGVVLGRSTGAVRLGSTHYRRWRASGRPGASGVPIPRVPGAPAAVAKRSLRSVLTQVERCVLQFSVQHI